jgi:hypothetical protein
MKAYSTPADAPKQSDGGILLAQAATVFYDAIERVYPNYPSVSNIKLADRELVKLSIFSLLI